MRVWGVPQANMDANFEAWVQYQLSLAAGAYAYNSMGHLLAAALPTAETAMLFVGGVFTLTNIFCGLYIVSVSRPPPPLCVCVAVADCALLLLATLQPRPQIPRGWIWMYWINPAAHMAQGVYTSPSTRHP